MLRMLYYEYFTIEKIAGNQFYILLFIRVSHNGLDRYATFKFTFTDKNIKYLIRYDFILINRKLILQKTERCLIFNCFKLLTCNINYQFGYKSCKLRVKPFISIP